MALAGVALLSAVARPLWDILVFAFEEPFPDHGGAVVFFINESPEEVRLLSFRLGEREELGEARSGDGYAVTGPNGRGSRTVFLVSALAGQQQAVVRYRMGPAEQAATFAFHLELVALSQCDVRVWFSADGPRASPCVDPRPAAYGGTWQH
jgi:hypothetical protein